MTDQLLTPKEASEYLRASVSWLANKRIYGGGPDFIKTGQKVWYRESSLNSWLAAHTVVRHREKSARMSPGGKGRTSHAMDV